MPGLRVSSWANVSKQGAGKWGIMYAASGDQRLNYSFFTEPQESSHFAHFLCQDYKLYVFLIALQKKLIS